MSRDHKYSLAMIVRNCADDLRKCLSSYATFPDEIVIVNTALDKNETGYEATNEVALEFGAKLFDFPWVGDFSKARQHSFDQCSHDTVMWLDTDDVVLHPERLNNNIHIAFRKGATCLFVEYLYEWDENDNCTTRLMRERIVDRRVFKWKAPIHECLIADWQHQAAGLPPEGGAVKHAQHRHDKEGIKRKLLRNIEVFEQQFESGEAEARMMFYWGNTLMGLGRADEALEKYETYTRMDRTNIHQAIVARVAMSECCRHMKRFAESLRHAHAAVALDSRLPSPWLQLAETYMVSNQHERAIQAADETLARIENLNGEMVTNPTAVKGRPHFIKAFCLANSGKFEPAMEHAQEAMKFWPDHAGMKDVMEQVMAAGKRRNLVGAFCALKDELQSEGAGNGAVKDLARSLPRSLMVEPEVHRYIPKDRKGTSLSIAFLCPGSGYPEWGPDWIEKGIGGSEEAVINMSHEFAELGWEVEVYCQRQKAEFINGVMWHPYHEWTGENDNPLDVTIFWRYPNLPLEFGSNSKLSFLWLHDMPQQSSWRFNQWNLFDGIFLLSDYHRSSYGFIPDEKVILSRNGLDPTIFADLSKHERNPHQMIWASDPSRGLHILLGMWDRIKEEVPEAQINVFYGWTDLFFQHMEAQKAQGVTLFQEIYEAIEKGRKKPGVNWRDKIGQTELNEEFARSGVWAYPSVFPEISCITGIKAQAHGTIPVTVDDFAMADTVKHGIKIAGSMHEEGPRKAYEDALIGVLKFPDRYEQLRAEMVEYGRSQTWAAVANEWSNLFKERLAWNTKSRRLERGNVEQITSILSA